MWRVGEVDYEWRGAFTSHEANALHADAFDHREYAEDEWDWVSLCETRSLGWVTARSDGQLIGFVNVITDGLVHAWLQDVMVAPHARNQGVGATLVRAARHGAQKAGCEWLHVDFDDHLRPFYYDVLGFRPTNGGLMDLTETP